MQLKTLPLRNCAACLALASCLAAPAAAEPAKLWEVSGLENPESALPLAEAGIVYVSNVAGSPTDKDGNGFISTLSLEGKVTALKWATGLDAPKGLALAGSRLYVSDIDRLVEIDTNDGRIVASHAAKDAKFLNDVAADSEGRVYVSDMFTNTIWRLAGGKFEPWLESSDLNGPNGLLVQGDRLIVAAWGVMAGEGKAGVPASLIEVSLPDKSVRPLGSGKGVGNLDGIVPLGASSYLVTDWVAGALYRIDASGAAELLIDFNQGSADIGYIADSKAVLVPLMMENRLEAYKIE
jgi:hypothetical protein